MSDIARIKRRTREPTNIDKDTWFYEEPEGLLFVRQIRDSYGSVIRPEMFTVPWRKVIAAVNRRNTIRAEPLGGRRE